MRKTVVGTLAALAIASVALAAKPKPMECDAWACKGDSCAPAKYQAVRHSIVPTWLLDTPVYGAGLTEAGVLAIALLVPYSIRRRTKGSEVEPEAVPDLGVTAP